MQRRSRQNPLIKEFIFKHVEKYSGNVASLAAKEFGITRAAINKYMKNLIAEGLIIPEGNTNARHYKIKTIVDETFSLRVTVHLEEDVVWRHNVLPFMKGVKQNIMDICQYGFTEMLNNVVDHSASHDALIRYKQTPNSIDITIIDHGIGIFNKIQTNFNLPDPRSALLELSKGKLTSYPSKHSGEGIFFTSRMFDKFIILSDSLFYTRERQDDDEWLIESGDQEEREKGTYVRMHISTHADWTTREVFDKYQNDGIGFRKTHVPVKLSKYPGEQLVSRSQAKRVLSRFDNFSEVMLDFKEVQNIGQAFADEIFRVFKNEHPNINIVAVNTTPEIEQMISHVKNAEMKHSSS